MISLNSRIDLLDKLGKYLLSDDEQWITAKKRATDANGFFTKESIEMATENIAQKFLNKNLLNEWISKYDTTDKAKTIGVVMAGNIPMVGFHDMLCVFVSGHKAMLKLSSKDEVLITHIVQKMIEWNEEVVKHIIIADRLNNCDAYIATGSNNTSRYFEQYFKGHPNIIRKNRTSVAVLSGNETAEDIEKLGDDIFSYFGLGCRNISKLYLPRNYDITFIMKELESREAIINFSKYKNNYDYYLSIYLLNKVKFYTNGSLILLENKEYFSPISVINYEFYEDKQTLINTLQNDDNIQCIIDNDNLSFGEAQSPSLYEYADGVDTMMFLSEL